MYLIMVQLYQLNKEKRKTKHKIMTASELLEVFEEQNRIF